jgi:hypothetical protein
MNKDITIFDFNQEDVKETGLECPLTGRPIYYLGERDLSYPVIYVFGGYVDGEMDRSNPMYTKELGSPYYTFLDEEESKRRRDDASGVRDI